MTKILFLIVGGAAVYYGIKMIRSSIEEFSGGKGDERKLWEGIGLTVVGVFIFFAPML